MDETMTADAITEKRIDRRSAMKAAIGGAAAATALAGPGISGFSFAPDFAAAASQCPAGTNVSSVPANVQRQSIDCNVFTGCWGTACCNNLTLTALTVNAASGAYSDPVFTPTVSGQVHNANGNVAIVVTSFNLNLPFDRCTINVTGAGCSGGRTFSATPASHTVTANGTFNSAIRCSGNPLTPDNPTVTITASCRCTSV